MLDEFNGLYYWDNGPQGEILLSDLVPTASNIRHFWVSPEDQIYLGVYRGYYVIEPNRNYEYYSYPITWADPGLYSTYIDDQGRAWASNGISLERSGRFDDFNIFPYPNQVPGSLGLRFRNIHPVGGNSVWASLSPGEYGITFFDGEEWEIIWNEDYDFPLRYVTDFVKSQPRVYWATSPSGMYLIKDVRQEPAAAAPELQGLSVFPNPGCCNFTVTWEQADGAIQIELINALGQPVRTLLQQEYGAGVYQHTFNRLGLPNGAYYLHVKEGDQIASVPLIIH